jgi:tRNA pseudouridine13 synthase
LKVPLLERELGIEIYASKPHGIGGKIRQFSQDFVVEEILVDSSKASIEVSPRSEIEGNSKERYLICWMIKSNWDTFLAIRKVAKSLGISLKRVEFAGLKDTKALTAQHISLENISPQQLKRIKIKDLSLHPIRFSTQPVFPHLLFGNHFKITIRAISYSFKEIKRRIEEVRDELFKLGGVPNFFGHQRFGTTRPITHHVGKALVQGDIEKAALTFLAKAFPYEHPQSKTARKQLWKTRNFEEALKIFPKSLFYERQMLGHLAKHPEDFVGAFRTLSSRLRKLFPQAYQSYLFNRFLSRRIMEGIPLNETRVGDYVVLVDRNGLPTDACKQVDEQSISNINKALQEGRMRLALPLIGYKQPPSKGVQGEIEQKILEEEKIEPKDFQVKALPEIRAAGGLRTALTPILNFSFKPPKKDEANFSKKMLEIAFTLQRGSYATILLREIMKPKNLVKAGF